MCTLVHVVIPGTQVHVTCMYVDTVWEQSNLSVRSLFNIRIITCNLNIYLITYIVNLAARRTPHILHDATDATHTLRTRRKLVR